MEPPASNRMRRHLLHPPSPMTRSRPIYPPGSRPPSFPLLHANPLSTLPHLDWDLQHQILRPTFRVKMPPQPTSPSAVTLEIHSHPPSGKYFHPSHSPLTVFPNPKLATSYN
ncbi:hypothetical protein TIFTF001_029137 [Ficus carica]|uniref:Uncharacterized protein n=1 Tax=Ficus carica TaxID=3494 RepID=A0AA88DRB4_FICCA|nr:hypothetical protein TIFTF001_029137 [Ficus carica]